MSGPTPGSMPVPPPGGWIDTSKASISQGGAHLVAPVTIFYLLGLIAIGLRFWARRIKKSSWQLSDYAIIVAALNSTGYLIICWITAARGGLGYPLVKVDLSARLLVRKAFFAAWLIQCFANTFVRLSILDFIFHVFHPMQGFRIAVYCFEVATVAYLVGFTISWFATCRPIRYNWALTPDVPQHCGDLALKFLLSSIFNLILDFGILILPMPVLWTLHMNRRKKIAITFVFGLGTFVVFSTAWRTYNVVEFSKPAAQRNFTVAIIDDALWSGLEITLGIINACLPVIQPAVKRIYNAPFFQLLSFSTSRFGYPKNSKMSDSYAPSSNKSQLITWGRLGSSKGESKTGIEREVAYSVDVESNTIDRVPMEDMGSFANLTTQAPVTYHQSLTNQYYVGDHPK
ncbi:hypothetical protein F4802DRAFT_600753 [Xylaria palmicola]|nr:hypothetical protein F4802DRAFT_600753 [Xylaria palmicola]